MLTLEKAYPERLIGSLWCYNGENKNSIILDINMVNDMWAIITESNTFNISITCDLFYERLQINSLLVAKKIVEQFFQGALDASAEGISSI